MAKKNWALEAGRWLEKIHTYVAVSGLELPLNLRTPGVRFRFRKATFDTLPYALYVPRGTPPEKGWPLVVFLHGAGQRGSDGRKQIAVGLPRHLKQHPERWPGIVTMPQCPEGLYWEGPVLESVYRLIMRLEQEFGTDPERLYLTGLSLGGHGTWNLACLHPDRFAAIVPMCGAADPLRVALALQHMPVWNFHGTDDDVVPVEFSRVLELALKKNGNKTHRFTEYDGVGHAVWDVAYANEELPRWLFAQRRKG